MAPLSAESIAANTTTVASLPELHQQLEAAILSPASTLDDLARIIGNEPGLAARLLKLANSALYRHSGPIETITRALTLIGTRQLQELALATLVIERFRLLETPQLSMREFWRNALATAIAARVIAIHLRERDSERFFLAGLFHKIGRLVLFTDHPELATQSLIQAQQAGLLLSDAEEQLLGFHHAEIGHALLKQWNLPALHCEGVRHHIAPSIAPTTSLVACIVHLANWLADGAAFGHAGDHFAPRLDPGALRTLGLCAATLESLLNELERQYQDVEPLLLGETDG